MGSLPVSQVLAAQLASDGARFVVVGSAALRFRGVDISVGDLDIVPLLDADNLPLLREAIGRVCLRPHRPPEPSTLRAVNVWTALTVYGRLDVLGERARVEGRMILTAASAIRVADVEVMVASAETAWALRARFKDSPEGFGRRPGRAATGSRR